MTAAAGTSLVIAVGVMHVLAGELTIGLLLVIITYVGSVYTPLQAISNTVCSLQEKIVDLKMAFDLLESEPEIVDPPDAAEISSCDGHLRFENVSFSYNGRGQVLSNLDFEILPGQFVALVGPTGAGKTSLIGLLPKFYLPQEGRILLDGVDISRIGLKSLRRQISLVTQEPLLSSGSIAENILYGNPRASQDEVVAAARAAQIDEFIRGLPAGYETLAGECSRRLSAGERQRITLARAFLRDAPILILDEPTSCLDASTERNILTALRNLIQGRTALMVAHRLSTIRSANLILVIDRGRIIEAGSHDDLLATGSFYSQLWRDHLRSSTVELAIEEG
jgi:ABC-type multidrug transport system fused ATPase/permease subunit